MILKPRAIATTAAWFLVPPEGVPERWKHRAVGMALIPLLPEEAGQALRGEESQPAIEPEDALLARLLARDYPIRAIALEIGMSVRGVQYRLARLRRRFQAETTADLRRVFAGWGLDAS